MASHIRRRTRERIERRRTWFHRWAFPAGSRLGLGDPGEFYKDEPDLPGYKDLLVAAKRLGYAASPSWELTHNLLPDVIDAALAVDYVADQLLATIEETEREFAAHLHPPGPVPLYGFGISDWRLADALVEVANLFAHIRSVGDRITRRVPGGDTSGLLSALKPRSPLAARVKQMYDAFSRDVLVDARSLAAYALHESRIPHPLAAHAAIERGRLEIKIPNRAIRAVRTPLGLRYSQRRTVRSYLRKTLPKVRRLVDDLLEAFEDEIPARVRR